MVRSDEDAAESDDFDTDSGTLAFEVLAVSREVELAVVESGASMLEFLGDEARALESSSSSEESRQMISGDVDRSTTQHFV